MEVNEYIIMLITTSLYMLSHRVQCLHRNLSNFIFFLKKKINTQSSVHKSVNYTNLTLPNYLIEFSVIRTRPALFSPPPKCTQQRQLCPGFLIRPHPSFQAQHFLFSLFYIRCLNTPFPSLSLSSLSLFLRKRHILSLSSSFPHTQKHTHKHTVNTLNCITFLLSYSHFYLPCSLLRSYILQTIS